MEKITKISKKISIPEEYLIPYGHYKAKIDFSYFETIKNKKDGKLILVTALTPTRTGEGKTTISIALADGLRGCKKDALLCLREPSLGPVFGLKGGATGGGLISVIPSEDINLHFNGDLHALTSAINLIGAVIDNHIFQGNDLQIDDNRVLFTRSMDMNDRALRKVIVNNDKRFGNPRNEEFCITVANELMAILCLAKDPQDFYERINNISVAYNKKGERIYIRDLRIGKAIMKLMKDALSPNLVQTIAGTPCLIHGGPFANIAHGCNSVIANKIALKISDYVVTEAGFGADLGAEKFFDIHVPALGKNPDAAVFVVTLKALKSHGGVAYEDLSKPNTTALMAGTKNVEQHMENISKFGVPAVIAINKFSNDHPEEIEAFKEWCGIKGYKYALVTGFDKGVKGCMDLANVVMEVLDTKRSHFKTMYDLFDSIDAKINKVAKEIYRADGVTYSKTAETRLKELVREGFDDYRICIAKTPASFSDNPELLNAPRGFSLKVDDINVKTGAKFVVVLCGGVITMPGLPKIPNAVKMEDETLDWLK